MICSTAYVDDIDTNNDCGSFRVLLCDGCGQARLATCHATASTTLLLAVLAALAACLESCDSKVAAACGTAAFAAVRPCCRCLLMPKIIAGCV